MTHVDPRPVRAVLFDLGNVVLEIDFMRAFETWARFSGVDAQALRDRFVTDQSFEQFERGEIGEEAYFRSLSSSLGIGLDKRQWVAGWNALLLKEKPGIRGLIERVRSRYPVYLFTNTNPTHQQQWSRSAATVLALFEELYVSSELGVRKPEPHAYQLVAQRMEVSPESILFFDDVQANIEGARAVGIQAVHTLATQTVADTVEVLLQRNDSDGT